jgi:hypothetical protein
MGHHQGKARKNRAVEDGAEKYFYRKKYFKNNSLLPECKA